MKILITGGAGFVGGSVTSLLGSEFASKHDVMVYDSLLYEEEYRKPLRFQLADVRDRDKLKPYLGWADAVIWLAAIVGDGACALNPQDTTEVNYEAVKYLAENFDGRIIFPSTCSVYGAQEELLTEDSPTRPLSLYASTKLKCESLLEDKNAIVFRLGTLYGLGDVFSRIRLDLVVNTLTAKAYGDKRMRVFGGEQYRPLLHVLDAAEAMVNAITSEATGIYNLHSQNMKIIDIARQVKYYLPDAELETVETSFEDARNYKVSSEKARSELGFTPKLDVKFGVSEINNILPRVKSVTNARYSNVGFLSNAT